MYTEKVENQTIAHQCTSSVEEQAAEGGITEFTSGVSSTA